MLRSCPYCGRIHDTRYDCGKRPPKRWRSDGAAYRIHKSERWKSLSLYVRERDKFLCQICLRRRYGTVQQYNSTAVSVHHIIPITESEERAFDRGNLITLCRAHHEMAEAGTIPREELFLIVEEQERNAPPGALVAF